MENFELTWSISENALLLCFTVLSLALACSIARHPRKASAGILLGVLVGVALIIVTSAVVGLIANIIPFGQIDFWLVSLFSHIS
ncbi:hypothetical protein RMS29_014840 [Agrobacterium rosae]|uniref:Uncharacterized protein n=1 Tax=Agrobacterium rosae TaxID=1972867 RepID=A0ABU4W4U3_9HYPH|nr:MULTISPECIES: hypothetical protein [Agrobacterium]MBN7809047.1 hypothetical protein [Agrobacterium rosae]MDX8332808.1 hypothetical protein [Agrobacterium rosae]SCX27242.1 hypothetical protein DSM25558_4185 [Agrobacterium sp. DSM 25558]